MTALSAVAAEPDRPPLARDVVDLPNGSVSLVFGGAARAQTLTGGSIKTSVDLTPSLSSVRLTGNYFFNTHLGVEIDLRGSTYFAVGVSPFEVQADPTKPKPARFWMNDLHANVAGVGRWAPLSWLRFEASVGYHGTTDAALLAKLDLTVTHVTSSALSAGGRVGLEFSRFAVAYWLRLVPLWAGTVGGAPMQGGVFLDSGLTFAIPVFRAPTVSLAAVGDVTFAGTTLRGGPYEFGAVSFTLGAGVRLSFMNPPGGIDPGRAAFTRLEGVVTREDGQPAAGAEVTEVSEKDGVVITQSATVLVDANGHFQISPAARGALLLHVKLPGFVEAMQPIFVADRNVETVTVALRAAAPTGPGKIRGVVTGPDRVTALAGVEIVAEGKPKVISDAKGEFFIESVGPGPVKLTVKAKGFNPAEELVQVPPGAESTVNLAMVEQVMATLRGLIRSASGKAVAASVKITELKQAIRVAPDGRFVVQVPAGTWTLTISAPGFVPQVKSVEVAGGDQTIFHCDLQPVGK